MVVPGPVATATPPHRDAALAAYAMESGGSPQHVQLKLLRVLFGVKLSLYQRILKRCAEDCSNQYLAGLAYDCTRVLVHLSVPSYTHQIDFHI